MIKATVWQSMGDLRRWRRDVEFEVSHVDQVPPRLKKEGFYLDDLAECEDGFTFTDMRMSFFVEVVE